MLEKCYGPWSVRSAWPMPVRTAFRSVGAGSRSMPTNAISFAGFPTLSTTHQLHAPNTGHGRKENSCQPFPAVISSERSWTWLLFQLSTAPRRAPSLARPPPGLSRQGDFETASKPRCCCSTDSTGVQFRISKRCTQIELSTLLHWNDHGRSLYLMKSRMVDADLPYR